MKEGTPNRAVKDIEQARQRMEERRRAFEREKARGARLTDHRFKP